MGWEAKLAGERRKTGEEVERGFEEEGGRRVGEGEEEEERDAWWTD